MFAYALSAAVCDYSDFCEHRVHICRIWAVTDTTFRCSIICGINFPVGGRCNYAHLGGVSEPTLNSFHLVGASLVDTLGFKGRTAYIPFTFDLVGESV